jgi:predicted DNA-binding WGR domain protein
MTALTLHRIDPPRMRRFYLLDVQPDLFGEWSFIREWGRAGQPGQVWAVPFSTEAEVQAALDRQRRAKERRGYCGGGRCSHSKACFTREPLLPSRNVP